MNMLLLLAAIFTIPCEVPESEKEKGFGDIELNAQAYITFLPRSKCPLISWLQSPSAVILEPQK